MTIRNQAQGIASLGRYGDSMLIHMNPDEIRMLSQMGELTVNPRTGLPEAFLGLSGDRWKGILKGVGSIAAPMLGSLIPGIGTALGAALASSLYSGVTDRDLKKALLSGATAYAGGKAFEGAKKAVGAGRVAAEEASRQGALATMTADTSNLMKSFAEKLPSRLGHAWVLRVFQS